MRFIAPTPRFGRALLPANPNDTARQLNQFTVYVVRQFKDIYNRMPTEHEVRAFVQNENKRDRKLMQDLRDGIIKLSQQTQKHLKELKA